VPQTGVSAARGGALCRSKTPGCGRWRELGHQQQTLAGDGAGLHCRRVKPPATRRSKFLLVNGEPVWGADSNRRPCPAEIRSTWPWATEPKPPRSPPLNGAILRRSLAPALRPTGSYFRGIDCDRRAAPLADQRHLAPPASARDRTPGAVAVAEPHHGDGLLKGGGGRLSCCCKHPQLQATSCSSRSRLRAFHQARRRRQFN